MKIAVDAFGGDNAPIEIIKGAVMASKEFDIDILLVGDRKKILACVKDNNIDINGIEIIDAEAVVSMHDSPQVVIKEKSNSSMAVALKLLADGVCDACVSAGSTGALIVGTTFIVKRIKGIKRIAIGTTLPTKTGNFFLMDSGANAECRPEMLLQFGIMSYVYVSNMTENKNPTVGLLNVGTEETKGGELQLQSYDLLKNAPINFIGNIEGRDLPANVCDIVITDGFTGNIVLKLYEGVSLNLISIIKEIFKTNIVTKIGACLVKPWLKGLKSKTDYSETGGALLLGAAKPVIKAHGSSNDIAIKNAIKQAKNAVEKDVVIKIQKTFK